MTQRTDVVTLGETLMLFTSPPGTMLLQPGGAGVRTSFVGAESNLAIGLARLGHGVRWLSVLGNDIFGDHIFKSLRGEGVDVARVVRSDDGPTGVLFKNRRPAAEPEIFYYRSNSAMSRAATPRAFAPDAWRGAEILYLTGITAALSDGCRELVGAMIADAREHGMRVCFDPNHRRKLWSEQQARDTIVPWLPHIDLLLAGDSEARLLSGATDVRLMAVALQEAGVREVVIKLGHHGAWHFSSDEEHFEPAFEVPHVVDPIGAGDAFAAGYLSAELDGLGVPDRLKRGNALGAIVCQTDGDWEGLPTRTQLDAYLAGQSESAR